MVKEEDKGIYSLIFLAFIFASMGLFARYLSTSFELFQQVYLRIFAAFVIGLFVFNRKLNFSKLKQISSREWAVLIFRAAAFYLLGVTLYTKSLILAKYSSVSFIGALPITALLGLIILKEKLNFHKLLALGVAFFGVILVSVKDFSTVFLFGQGEIIALLSAFSFSFSYIARRWQTKTLNNQEISQVILGLGFVMVFITSLFLGDPLPVSNWHLNFLLAVVGAGVFNIMNLFLVNYGFEKVKAVLASNILTLELAFAIVLGFIFYRELPNFQELAGGGLIVGSVIWMNYLENV